MVKTTTYTIHRGTVRTATALCHHVMLINARRSRANDALGKATAGLLAAEEDTARMNALVIKYGGDGVYDNAYRAAKMEQATCSDTLRAAQSELKTATARADEASKMHLVTFVPPYVPAKTPRVYPALKTCTSPRRAAKARARASDREIAAITEQTGIMMGVYEYSDIRR